MCSWWPIIEPTNLKGQCKVHNVSCQRNSKWKGYLRGRHKCLPERKKAGSEKGVQSPSIVCMTSGQACLNYQPPTPIQIQLLVHLTSLMTTIIMGSLLVYAESGPIAAPPYMLLTFMDYTQAANFFFFWAVLRQQTEQQPVGMISPQCVHNAHNFVGRSFLGICPSNYSNGSH